MFTEAADPSETTSDEAVDVAVDEPMSNRRRMLRSLALGAAGAAAAGAVVGGRPNTAAARMARRSPSVRPTPTRWRRTSNYWGATTAASSNVQSGDQTTANDTTLDGSSPTPARPCSVWRAATGTRETDHRMEQEAPRNRCRRFHR